jgi:nicotinamide-nucleotide amidase
MDHVKALLIRDFDLNAQTSHSRVVKILGPGDLKWKKMISDIIKNAGNYNLALLARDGEIDVRVTAEDTNHNDGQMLVDDIVGRISKALGDSVFGYDEDTLTGVVAKHLKKNNLTISVAESCTGGLLVK